VTKSKSTKAAVLNYETVLNYLPIHNICTCMSHICYICDIHVHMP